MTDRNNQKLFVGDLVVYATRSSCYPYLKIGVVSRVHPHGVSVKQVEASGVHTHSAFLTNADRLLVVGESHLTQAESKALDVYYANQNG